MNVQDLISDKAYIPKIWFVGINKNPRRLHDIALQVPGGTNKPAQNRIKSTTTWAKRDAYYGSTSEHKRLEPFASNEYIIKDLIYYNASKNDSALVLSPQGYTLELSLDNLIYIASKTKINNGRIIAEMQWVRSGKNNILLPTDSIEFIKIKERPRR